jgi:hypothetical protein
MPPSIEERAGRVLEHARNLSGRVESWAEFSNAIFAPGVGLAAQAFPTLRERRAFTLTPQYEEIYRILYGLMRTFGVASGARSQLSHEQCVRMERQLAKDGGQERAP